MDIQKQNQFYIDLVSGVFAGMVRETVRGKCLQKSDETFNVLKPLMAEHDDDVEALFGIFMDSGNQVISIDKVFSGSINLCPVFPRELVKKAIAYKAGTMIIGHNHPTGDPSPSIDDESITKKVQCALHVVSVTLHDHIIVGDNSFFSFADEGIIMKNTKSINDFFEGR